MEMVESAHQDLVFNRFRKQKELSAANGFNPELNRAKTDYNQICGLSRLSTKVRARLLGFVNKIGPQAFIHASIHITFTTKPAYYSVICYTAVHCRLLLLPFPLLRIQKLKIIIFVIYVGFWL